VDVGARVTRNSILVVGHHTLAKAAPSCADERDRQVRVGLADDDLTDLMDSETPGWVRDDRRHFFPVAIPCPDLCAKPLRQPLAMPAVSGSPENPLPYRLFVLHAQNEVRQRVALDDGGAARSDSWGTDASLDCLGLRLDPARARLSSAKP
jgi:hypothetical protein